MARSRQSPLRWRQSVGSEWGITRDWGENGAGGYVERSDTRSCDGDLRREDGGCTAHDEPLRVGLAARADTPAEALNVIATSQRWRCVWHSSTVLGRMG